MKTSRVLGIVLITALFITPTISRASTDIKTLQSLIESQQVTVQNWTDLHPDKTKEQRGLLYSIRLSVLRFAFGTMNGQNVALYEQYYSSAVGLYDKSAKASHAAQESFTRKDYTAAQSNLVASISYLGNADGIYAVAIDLWMGQLNLAQDKLYKICNASSKTAANSLGSIGDIVSGGVAATALSLGLNAAATTLCNDQFGHNSDVATDVITGMAQSLETKGAETLLKGSAPAKDLGKAVSTGFSITGWVTAGIESVIDFFKPTEPLTNSSSKFVSTAFLDQTPKTKAPTSPAQSQTLGVLLSASPSSVTAGQSASITANVSGRAQGTIHYQIDCTNNGGYEVDVVQNTNPFTASCSYPSSGTYSARVHVERGTASPTEATTNITVVVEKALKKAKTDEEQRIAEEARKKAEEARIAAEQEAQKHQQEEQRQSEEQRKALAAAEEAKRKEQAKPYFPIATNPSEIAKRLRYTNYAASFGEIEQLVSYVFNELTNEPLEKSRLLKFIWYTGDNLPNNLCGGASSCALFEMPILYRSTETGYSTYSTLLHEIGHLYHHKLGEQSASLQVEENGSLDEGMANLFDVASNRLLAEKFGEPSYYTNFNNCDKSSALDFLQRDWSMALEEEAHKRGEFWIWAIVITDPENPAYSVINSDNPRFLSSKQTFDLFRYVETMPLDSLNKARESIDENLLLKVKTIVEKRPLDASQRNGEFGPGVCGDYNFLTTP